MQSKDGGEPLYVKWDSIYKEEIKPVNPGILKWIKSQFFKEETYLKMRENVDERLQQA